MKIICLIDNLGSGGAQRQLTNLAILFKEAGHDVEVLTYHSADFFLPILSENHIKYTCINQPNYIKRLIKLRKYLRSSNQDAVLSFLDTPNFIALLSAIGSKKWKLVVSERSCKEENFRNTKTRFIKKFYVFADYIVANSENAANMWRKYYPNLNDKIKVIYNTIDINIDENISYISKKNGKLNMVIAASYQTVKNPLNFIAAINNLTDYEKEQIFVNWYGELDFPYSIYKDVENKIKECNLENVVSLNPATNQILSIMKRSDIVGIFSILEGLPNSICEAMCLGKPIIMTRVSDYKILVDDTNGFLCDSDDIASITAAIRSAIFTRNEKLQDMGHNSYEKSKKLFFTEKIVKNFIELFK